MNSQLNIQYCTMQNTELFAAVLKLRYDANRVDNLLPWQRSWLDMRDDWDNRSVMIVASVNNEVCGSVRITINNSADAIDYPVQKVGIDPSDCVEASRLCIVSTSRGQGLMYQLAAQMIILSHQTGRRYIVGCARDELIPTWSKIGFKIAGYRYFNHAIGGTMHETMILDIAEVIKGACDKSFHTILLAAMNAQTHESEDVAAILHRS